MRISDIDMGRHVLLNLYECGEIERLKNLSAFSEFISDTLAKSRAEVVGNFSHKFQPESEAGFTSLSLLTTSHFSIHTWPEHASAAVDVFTCGSVDTDNIVTSLVEYFGSGTHTVETVLR